jgi:hypothetical protein
MRWTEGGKFSHGIFPPSLWTLPGPQKTVPETTPGRLNRRDLAL